MRSFLITMALLGAAIIAGRAQNPGDNLFGSDQVHEVRFTFTQPNYWDSLIDYKLQGDQTDVYQYMLASVEIDGNLLSSVGVRMKGNSSFNHPNEKRPFKIDFNRYVSGQKYDGLRKLNLNNNFKDPTMMREKLMLDFCQEQNIPAPRCTYSNLYVNDVHWGFYCMVEQIDGTYLDMLFGNSDGNHFKGDPMGKLKWEGSNESSYYGFYELKTNEIQNDWSDLVHLIDMINNTTSNNFFDSLEAVLNTQLRIKAWAVNSVFVNLDSQVGSGHNYYIYHDTFTDQFNWVLCDVNEAFGNFSMSQSINQLENLPIFWFGGPPNDRPLVDKMLQNSTYKTYYVNTICAWLDDEFSTTSLYPKIDSLADKIRAHVYADPNKMFDNNQFEINIDNNLGNNFPGLKSFINNRWSSLTTQVSNEGCTPGMDENSPEQIAVFPNPVSDLLQVKTDFEVDQSEIYDVTGRLVMTSEQSGKEFTLDVAPLPPGLYLLKMYGEQSAITRRIIIE